jgi:hypothetical protein
MRCGWERNVAGKPTYKVMLSSTYKELAGHREAVRDAMLRQDFFPVSMENDSALPDHTLITASLGKVDEADGYVGLLGYRYGQTPEDALNPEKLSLTELEFRRAVERKIPICMFLMRGDHPVPLSALLAVDDEEKRKLAAFVERAKQNRIWADFGSIEELRSGAIQSLGRMREGLDQRAREAAVTAQTLQLPAEDRPNAFDLPSGWEIVDRDSLAKIRANPPPLDIMVQFFDGILPTWRLALAPGVEPRAIAERLANRLRAVYAGAAKPEVVLLSGAGGEGKSTAVLHAAAALIEDTQQVWTCLHRQAANAELPEDTFAKLPSKQDHAWVVVIDDADNVAPAILVAVKKVAARTDVHLLLAARDAEWQLKRLVPGMWQPLADFHTELLAGLDQEDARRIVVGWAAWGDEAMGKLKGRSERDATTALLGHAREFAAREEAGELLGALLVTRKGEDMRSHVRTLVNGLGRKPVIKTYSLHDIYAMVAAMHTENQLYLSRSVLACALGCDLDELERKVLLPLRREAMLDAGDTYVLTRHRRIAEAACTVMREDRDDIDRWYAFLARAALLDFKKNFTRDPNIGAWNFRLAQHFVEKGERGWAIGRAIAKAVYEAEPSNVQSLTALTSVLRRTGRAAEAMTVLKDTGGHYRNYRGVLYEWSTVAGAAGDHGLATWLCGRTLADGGEPIDPIRCKLSLAGLGLAFRELFTATQEKALAAAEAACGQLGLRLTDLDATTRGYFERHAADGRRNGIAELSLEQAVDSIRKAVIRAANDVEPHNDPVFFEKLLGEPDGYRYTALLRIAGGTKAPPAMQRTKDRPGQPK